MLHKLAASNSFVTLAYAVKSTALHRPSIEVLGLLLLCNNCMPSLVDSTAFTADSSSVLKDSGQGRIVALTDDEQVGLQPSPSMSTKQACQCSIRRTFGTLLLNLVH